jgi:hypothetical protein
MHPTYSLIPLALSALLVATPTLSAGPNGRQPVQSIQPIVYELNPAEIDDLTYMHEEERLARDVYMGLSAYWGDQGWPVLLFDNIARAEQTHMETLKSAMDRYGLDDASDPDVVGVYADPTLNDLYETLMKRGMMDTYMEALGVGALIEEVDIADLDEAIARTDNPDLQTIYANLQRGSRNHLRAFVAEIERQGVDYEAQALEQDTVNAIVDAPMERGGQGQRGENGQGGQSTDQGSQGGAGQRRGLNDEAACLHQNVFERLIAGNGNGQRKGQGGGQGQGKGRGSASAHGLQA